MNPAPVIISFHTKCFLLLFLVVYLFALIRRTSANRIDLVDFILLGTVALIPAVFAFFPALVFSISGLVGVVLPYFYLLFGSLVFVLFVLVFLLIQRIKQLEKRTIALIQEVGLQNFKTNAD